MCRMDWLIGPSQYVHVLSIVFHTLHSDTYMYIVQILCIYMYVHVHVYPTWYVYTGVSNPQEFSFTVDDEYSQHNLKKVVKDTCRMNM